MRTTKATAAGLMLALMVAVTAAMKPLPMVSTLKPATRAPPPRMMPVGVLLPAVAGGTFAGGLHAVTGPDHLAALLPLCIGRRWWEASSTGAFWGLGHGVGAALVGVLGFALRGVLNLQAITPYMEAAVGTSIMVIGFTGYREARAWAENAEECPLPHCPPQVLAGPEAGPGRLSLLQQARPESRSASHLVMSNVCDEPPPFGVARTLLNGVLNGVSGTGHILGVLPALAMPNWAVAGVYLGCFGLGTLVAMALFTGVVGELSSQLSSYTPAAPATSAMAASIFALVMGSLWTLRALAGLGLGPALAAMLS